jgi:hypothetical protein
MRAPASTAATAVSAFIVSMLTIAPSAARAATTGSTRSLLLGRVDALRAGPGRLAADVEDVGARRAQREAVRDRGLGVEVAAAVAERVGRDVDDAHDEGHVRRPPVRAS